MTSNYIPQPGTLAARAIAHFASLPVDAQLTNGVLAESLAVDPNSLTPCLQAPMRHGLLERFKADGHIFWRRGHAAAAPAAETADDDSEEGDDSIARVIAAADAAPLAGLAPQSWCPAPAESKSSLDEPPAPPHPSPAPALGLGWRAPTLPVYRGEPSAPVPSPRPAAAPEPGPGATLLIEAGVLTAEDDPDFREVEHAPRPPEPDTPPKGAEAAQAPVSPCGRDDATPNDGVVPQDTKRTEFRCALWSSGELHIEIYPGNFLLLTKDETRQLVGYLDRMREPAE